MDGPQPTLYQDWQVRRERLDQQGAPTWRHLDFQRPVLEFLIKRYAGDPVAQNPALFPLPSKLIVFQRTGVIQHHLSKHLNWSIKTEKDAAAKTSSILERIKQRKIQEEVKAPAGGSIGSMSEWLGEYSAEGMIGSVIKGVQDSRLMMYGTGPSVLTEARLAFWMREFSHSDDAQRIQMLDRVVHWYTTPTAPQHQRAFAMDVLRIMGEPKHLPLVLDVWRLHLCDERPNENVTQQLESVLGNPLNRTEAVLRLRTQLDHTHLRVRLSTIRLLEKLGGLDDIGLLADLHALPPEAISDETEREKLADAMKKLSGLENRST